jgi:hypothetical protein
MPPDDDMLRALPPGLTVHQIAQRLGIGYKAAWAKCRAVGYVPMRQRQVARERRWAHIRALPPGLTVWQVAKRMGSRYSTAWAWCQEAGYPPVHERRTARERWVAKIRALPENLNLKDVARRLGIPYSTAYHRAQMAGCRFRRPVKKVPPERWLHVDWTQPDAAIGHRLGVSRERVRQIRKDKGITPVRSPSPIRLRRQRQFARLPAGLCASEIARRLKLPDYLVWKWCQRLGYSRATQNDRTHAQRQAQFRKLKPGLLLTQIAARLGVSCMCASRWAARFGYRTGGNPWRYARGGGAKDSSHAGDPPDISAGMPHAPRAARERARRTRSRVPRRD